jgi:hypothetical protein
LTIIAVPPVSRSPQVRTPREPTFCGFRAARPGRGLRYWKSVCVQWASESRVGLCLPQARTQYFIILLRYFPHRSARRKSLWIARLIVLLRVTLPCLMCDQNAHAGLLEWHKHCNAHQFGASPFDRWRRRIATHSRHARTCIPTVSSLLCRSTYLIHLAPYISGVLRSVFAT